jgi:photosystem II stability/assembly factor-like uncharacterized protein
MTEMSDRALKLALDALDARQVPPAVRDWDSRALAALKARPPRMHRSRLRLLVAACVALAVFAFLASGAGAWVGLPNPLDLAFHRGAPSGHKPARPQALPSASPSHASATPSATPSEPSPTPSRSAPAQRRTASPSPAKLVPPSWPFVPAASRAAWHRRNSGTTANLTSVDFVDGAHGWAVGDPHGAIVATTDGGVSWAPQPSGYDRYLTGVAFADAEHGWAVGFGPSRTVMLATTNGGASWRRAGLPGHFSRIAAVDATHAWAVGEGLGETDGFGSILTTSDGRTWHQQDVPVCKPLTAVSFADAEHGWAVGWGTIIATTNGGDTWKAQKAPYGADLTSVCFVDALHGWAAGGLDRGPLAGRAVVLATSDGGATWRRVGLGDHGTFIYSMTFAGPLQGWALSEYANGHTLRYLLLATSDGGASWRTERSIARRAPIALADLDTRHVCLVGIGGVIYTMDAGP